MARMRGDDRQPDAMFSYVSVEERVPVDHPLRAIRTLVDDVLREMSREFDGLYARIGRPSKTILDLLHRKGPPSGEGGPTKHHTMT